MHSYDRRDICYVERFFTNNFFYKDGKVFCSLTGGCMDYDIFFNAGIRVNSFQ